MSFSRTATTAKNWLLFLTALALGPDSALAQFRPERLYHVESISSNGVLAVAQYSFTSNLPPETTTIEGVNIWSALLDKPIAFLTVYTNVPDWKEDFLSKGFVFLPPEGSDIATYRTAQTNAVRLLINFWGAGREGTSKYVAKENIEPLWMELPNPPKSESFWKPNQNCWSYFAIVADAFCIFAAIYVAYRGWKWRNKLTIVIIGREGVGKRSLYQRLKYPDASFETIADLATRQQNRAIGFWRKLVRPIWGDSKQDFQSGTLPEIDIEGEKVRARYFNTSTGSGNYSHILRGGYGRLKRWLIPERVAVLLFVFAPIRASTSIFSTGEQHYIDGQMGNAEEIKKLLIGEKVRPRLILFCLNKVDHPVSNPQFTEKDLAAANTELRNSFEAHLAMLKDINRDVEVGNIICEMGTVVCSVSKNWGIADIWARIKAAVQSPLFKGNQET